MRSLWMMLALLLPVAAGAQERVDLPSRSGVTQPVLVFPAPAARPVATVVLFPGGNGVYSQVRRNFLIRIVPDLLKQGFMVLVADAPSDQSGGMMRGFRAGAEHGTDIVAVVDFAKSRAAAPVWLIGTSNGAISAANGAVAAGRRIGGVVLSSSVWAQGMAAVPLEKIVVPVLVVHNRDDECPASPFAGVAYGMQRFTGAPVKELLAVSGGSARGDACQATSRHGYMGIEDLVIGPMSAWIKAH